MGREQNFFRVGKEVRYTLENVFSVKNALKNIRHDKNSYLFHEFRQFLTKKIPNNVWTFFSLLNRVWVTTPTNLRRKSTFHVVMACGSVPACRWLLGLRVIARLVGYFMLVGSCRLRLLLLAWGLSGLSVWQKIYIKVLTLVGSLGTFSL